MSVELDFDNLEAALLGGLAALKEIKKMQGEQEKAPPPENPKPEKSADSPLAFESGDDEDKIFDEIVLGNKTSSGLDKTPNSEENDESDESGDEESSLAQDNDDEEEVVVNKKKKRKVIVEEDDDDGSDSSGRKMCRREQISKQPRKNKFKDSLALCAADIAFDKKVIPKEIPDSKRSKPQKVKAVCRDCNTMVMTSNIVPGQETFVCQKCLNRKKRQVRD